MIRRMYTVFGHWPDELQQDVQALTTINTSACTEAEARERVAKLNPNFRIEWVENGGPMDEWLGLGVVHGLIESFKQPAVVFALGALLGLLMATTAMGYASTSRHAIPVSMTAGVRG